VTRGFGSFTVKEYISYTGRNPKTSERIKVEPKKLPIFRVGRELRRGGMMLESAETIEQIKQSLPTSTAL